MAEGQSMTVADVVAGVLAGEAGDFLREAVTLVARELMEAEISTEIGAARGEVSAERITHRNGYRPRVWETRVGELELAIRASGRARRTSPPSWSRADAASRRSSRSCWRRRQRRLHAQGRPLGRAARPAGNEARTVSPRCAGSSTSRSPRSVSGRWRAPTRICGLMPSSSRCETRDTSARRRLSSPTPSTRRADARCSGSTWARSSRRRSGSSSCARSGGAASTGCGSSSPTTTRASRRRPRACCPAPAALHSPFRPQHAPALPARPAGTRLRRAARGLQRRQPQPGA